MQTFLPYIDFQKSAEVLDRKRLGKQRVETLQILNTLTGRSTGWSNHPAVRMWRGYEYQLCVYGLAMIDRWKSLGYKDTCAEKIQAIQKELPVSTKMPPWLNSDFCLSHQSNLVRKDAEYYGKIFPNVKGDMPYIWPV